jgi:hypothetical protein
MAERKWITKENSEFNFVIETDVWKAMSQEQKDWDMQVLFSSIEGFDENNPIPIQAPKGSTVEDFLKIAVAISIKFGKITGQTIFLPAEADMLDVLVQAGIFPSRNQARKNWKGEITIQDGFQDFKASKGHVHIAIWKPTIPPE